MSRLSQRLLEEWLKIPRSVKMFVLNFTTIFIFLYFMIRGLKILFELSIDLPVLLTAAIVSLLFMIMLKKK